MKPTSGDEENESRETQWPSVPKIASADEFWQSVAVAELAVKLCELQKRELQNKWDAEDKKYARDMQTAVKEAEKQRVNEERKKQVESRIATLDRVTPRLRRVVRLTRGQNRPRPVRNRKHTAGDFAHPAKRDQRSSTFTSIGVQLRRPDR